ncbi:DUF805 domain-containing protein [Kocuria tytonis]|uniref:DUF805 domain-containing protein n=2 Tax=Kocuria tytonis TaxID=2054280 RepID=A0A495A6L2_9MICC|nr:DUF805 domain-containing protein [Kocuria tytonis]
MLRTSQPGEPVGPLAAVSTCLRKGFQFSGRASRSEYWWITLYVILLSAAQQLLESRLARRKPKPTEHQRDARLLPVLGALAGVTALVTCNVSLSVRRLHDVNRSGWWFLLTFIPGPGTIALLVMAALPSNPRGARFDRRRS